MPRFRFAVATRCFDLPLRASLSAAADSGAAGVQFDLRDELRPDELTASGRRDLLHLLDELGLRVASTTFTLRRPLADEYELDRRVAALKQAMTWSFTLHASVLTFRLGKLPSEPDGREAQTLREILADLASYANHAGVTLAAIPSRDTPDDVQRLIAGITTGPLGVDFDPAQCAMSGHDSVAALKTLHALTQHVQLRDGYVDLDGGGAETAVGQGAVQWLELLATLGEIEYAGWLTAIRTQGPDKPGDLRRAIASLQNMLLGR